MGAADPGRGQAIAALILVGALWSAAGALIKYVAWPPAAIWGAMLALGLLQQAVPTLFYAWAIRHVT